MFCIVMTKIGSATRRRGSGPPRFMNPTKQREFVRNILYRISFVGTSVLHVVDPVERLPLVVRPEL